MAWFQFHDMHSGGDQKTDWEHLFIEAPTRDAAIAIFTKRTGRDPEHETCSCCGEDFSISEARSLAEATGYERRCAENEKRDGWLERGEKGRESSYIPLDVYLATAPVLVIAAVPQ